MFDGAFNNILCTEDNNILLRWLLECCLEIKIDTLILKDKGLLKNKTHTKGKVVDLYIETNAELINVEINNHPHGYNNVTQELKKQNQKLENKLKSYQISKLILLEK